MGRGSKHVALQDDKVTEREAAEKHRLDIARAREEAVEEATRARFAEAQAKQVLQDCNPCS